MYIDWSDTIGAVESIKQRKAYNAWEESLQEKAAGHDLFSGFSQIVSMWNPIIGFGLDAINRGIQSHNMPGAFESNYFYTDPGRDLDYEKGSQDALLELKADIWSDLLGHGIKSLQYHGTQGIKESFGDLTSGFKIGDNIDIPTDPAGLGRINPVDPDIQPVPGDDDGGWRPKWPEFNPFERDKGEDRKLFPDIIPDFGSWRGSNNLWNLRS